MDGSYLKRALNNVVSLPPFADVPVKQPRWVRLLLCHFAGHDINTSSRVAVWRGGVMVTVRQECFRCGRTRMMTKCLDLGEWK